MSEYGQVINPQYDPSKNVVYDSFNEYFNNPVMTKIKNVEGFSVYMAKIYSLLGNAHRYLILFVNQDLYVNGSKKNMNQLEWVSLQTRTLTDNHNLPFHTYRVFKFPALDKKITILDRNEEKSTYNTEDYPITVILLHTRKNNVYQYQQQGTILSALETFQTIINFKVNI